ncbi:uncharacterized protein F4812DRAFT_79497 [Daldinia caldariorum]|uniref:uncharacterized protein n=1 Tax=Daldinia caldariorum TaxID=326644 RepID=UPI002008ACBF|nr:uncharacterized protein F4812DRAFT_79497 [Daldinia caldariorum]KAI1466468.1 hypothetical protein F4812DRAFT_79497 [Daldinia caldariorum]
MPLSNNAVPLVGVVTPFLAAAFLAVGLRLHVRVTLLSNSGIDDWLCVAAVLCSFGTYLANMAGVVVGFGNPLSGMTDEERVVALKTLWISPPLWGLSSSLIKLSIVTSYLRIWNGKPFKLFCYALVLFISLFGLALFFGGVFACVPIYLSWTLPSPGPGPGTGTSTIRDRFCIDLPMFMFATSIVNTALDLAVLAIPVPLLRKLRIAPRQRVALTAVFTVGAVVCVASIMRLLALYRLMPRSSSSTPTQDPSVSGLPVGIWSGVELDLAIICACLPTLRPMLARAFPCLLLGGGGGADTAAVDSSPSWRGTTKRVTRDENGTYRMHELHSDDEENGKLGNGDVEVRAIRAPAPLMHLERYNKSYMDFD